MLQKMRDKSQGLLAKIIIGAVVVTLTMFGFGAFTAFVSNDPPVASVNGDDITRDELRLETERQRQRILNQMGEGADPDLIDMASLSGSVLDNLINRSLMRQAADDMNLAVSDAEVDRFIRENPQFQVDGRYDPAMVERVLRSIGHTPMSFRHDFKDSLRMAQLNEAVVDTGLVIDWELRQMAALLGQTRDIAFLSFDPEDYAGEVELADDAVETYYQANASEFMTRETADFAYVALSIADLADESIDVTPADIETRYQENLAAFEAVDERRVSHILLEVNAERDEDAAFELAESIRDRIAQGEAFSDLAREYSDDPGSAEAGGDLGYAARGAYVPEFEDAVWTMDVGTVSEPVRTEFGVHVIEVTDVRAPEYPTLDEARDEIVAELRREGAATRYAEQVREMDRLAFEFEGLDAIVEGLGLEVITADGVSRTDSEGPFSNARLRDAAFSEEVLEQGFNSPVVDLGDRAYVVRVIEQHLPEQKPLEAVAQEIETLLRNREAQDLAAAEADRAYRDLLDGAASSAVSDTFGQEWVVLSNSRRQTPGVDPAITREAFALPRPTGSDRSVGSVRTGSGVEVVVTVTAVRPGDYAALTESERNGLRQQLERTTGERDFGGLFENLRETASIERG